MNLHRLILLLLGTITAVQAEDLQQVYTLALHRDPTLHAAYNALQADKQSLPQAVAQMLPNLSANYSTTANNQTSAFFNPVVSSGKFNTHAYGLTLSQPIYHPEFWAQFERARHVVKAAVASYLSADQALIIRTSQRYFNILAAYDDLEYAKGQRIAFSRQFEQAKQRFDVGIIAITDVETAKAKYDSAVADEISANNAISDQYELLREITGQPIHEVVKFTPDKPLPLLAPTPNTQEAWVDTAHLNNLEVLAARERAKIQKSEIGVQAAGHFPKVDVSGNLQRSKTPPPFSDNVYDRSATLNISIPIFASGGVLFRTKEAQSRYDQSLEELEKQQRETDSATRRAFRGVLTAMSSVKALAQAVVSNQSSVKATQAAYEVGTRTIVDVLDAESALLQAQRDYAKARYNYLYQSLLLKQAAGILTIKDLCDVNDLITNSHKH